MAEYLQNSVLWRVLRVIGLFLSRLVEGSTFLSACKRIWKGSALRKMAVSFGRSDDSAVRSSIPERFLRWMDRRLMGGRKLVTAVRESCFGRLLTALLRGCRNSRLVGWLFRRGLSSVLLLLLGLYAGIDWMLRDVLTIPVISTVWDEMLMILTLVWILWKRVDRKTLEPSRSTILDVHVLVFLTVALCLVFAVSPDFSIAVAGYRAVCQYMLWFFLVSRLIRNDDDCKLLYITMVVLAAGIGLHGVYQYIVGTPIPEKWTDAAEASVRTRSFSIFGSPNILADVMVMFAPMAAGLAYKVKETKWKLLAWFATLVMCFCCLFTMSRGGWVAMVVAVVVFALLVDRKLFGIVLLAAVVAMFMPFVASRLGYVFTQEFAESTAKGGRAIRWDTGMQYLLSTDPLLGFGLGRFGGAVAMQNQVLDIEYFYMDNYYMKTLVEMGYLGLAAFIITMLSLLMTGCRSLYKCAKIKADNMYPMAAGIFSGLCGVLVHCYFENIFEEPYMMASFWIMAAMLVYMGIYRTRKQNIQ